MVRINERRRCHRFRRGAGAAFPCRAWRPDAVDPRVPISTTWSRRNGLAILKVFLVAAIVMGGAVDPVGRHHRRAGAAAGRRPPKACAAAYPLAGRDSRFSRAAATRSAICPVRCAT